MKLSKKIAILATALISFAFISCDTDTDDSKPPAESSGSTEAGGSAGTGGSTSSGGSTEAGGSGGTGGSTEAGGGAGAGGSTESGGSGETGGSTGTGGAGETGGSTEPGGTTGSGGSGEAGGSTGPGGAGETGGSTEPGGSTGSGGESEGNPVLPGIKGGADNEKDSFAGKTFYDSVEKETAESYTKYVFSTDGTVEIYNKNDESDGTSADAVINYSFSEDGKIVYMTYNKFNDMLPGSGKLYTYEEFVQTGIDAIVKFYMDNVFINKEVPEEAKKEYAEMFGLEAYTTDDAVRDALKEKISNMVRKIFSSVYQYDLSSDAAGPAVLTERITWGTDLSKFISLNGDTYYSYRDSVLEFSFTHSAGGFNCTYVDQNSIDPDDEETLTRWIFSNVDDSKIYFKVKGETKVLGYTIFDDGNKLNLVIDNNPIVAELKLDKMSLYN